MVAAAQAEGEEADVAEAKTRAKKAQKEKTSDSESKTVRVTWLKSAIGYPKDQKATIAALGLHKLQHTVEHEDRPTLRGMIHKVSHLVEVEEIVSQEPGL